MGAAHDKLVVAADAVYIFDVARLGHMAGTSVALSVTSLILASVPVPV